MNHICSSTHTFQFAFLNYEYEALVPQQNRQQLLDITLSIHGRPTLTGPLSGTGCNDIRVYLEAVDVTPHILSNLRDSLAGLDQAALKAQYQRAVDDWLALEIKLSGAYGGAYQREQVEAARLTNIVPISALLDQLGNGMAAWGGNLHIFNFLYRFIDLPPISLLDIANRYNAQNPGKPIDLTQVNKITFSSGPCRLYDRAWDPIQNLPRGCISVTLTSVYHDPLEDIVESIQKITMPDVKEIILNSYGARTVYVQNRQAMKVGEPTRRFVMPGGRLAARIPMPIDWTRNGSLSFPMDGNDTYGDCLYAAACHGDNTFTGNHGPESIFALQSIVNSYLRLSPNDKGLNAGQIIGEWSHGLTGISDARIFDALNINPRDSAHVQAAIYYFGGIVFMLDIPDTWRSSFGPGVVWNAPAVADKGFGHAVLWNGVDGRGYYKTQTFGTYCWITPAGVADCDPSAFVVFSPRWFDSTGTAPNRMTYIELASLWQQFGGGVLPFRSRIELTDTTPLGPATAYFNGRLYIAYKAQTGPNIYLTSRSDGQPFGNRFASAETTRLAPALCVHGGDLYLAFQAQRALNICLSKVLVAADGSMQVTPSISLFDTTSSEPAMASFNGRLYIAYRAQTGPNIYLTSSRNGQNFDIRFASVETTGLPPSLCVHRGDLYLAFRANTGQNIRVSKVIVAADGSIQVTPSISLFDTTRLAPSIASFNNKLYIAYRAETGPNIYLVSSDDGQSFGNRFASFETTNLRPALAAGSTLFVAFRAEVGNNLLTAGL